MIKHYILFIALIVNTFSVRIPEKTTIEQFLDNLVDSRTYDSRTRPYFKENKPIIIKMNMLINSISGISEINMVSKR